MKDKDLEGKVNEKEFIRIDPSTSPYTPQNIEAARSRGLRYDPRSRCYRDSDGCAVADRFGQPLG